MSYALDEYGWTTWRLDAAEMTPGFVDYGMDITAMEVVPPDEELMESFDYEAACEQLWAVREGLVSL